jgi:hypothetical protein
LSCPETRTKKEKEKKTNDRIQIIKIIKRNKEKCKVERTEKDE